MVFTRIDLDCKEIAKFVGVSSTIFFVQDS